MTKEEILENTKERYYNKGYSFLNILDYLFDKAYEQGRKDAIRHKHIAADYESDCYSV